MLTRRPSTVQDNSMVSPSCLCMLIQVTGKHNMTGPHRKVKRSTPGERRRNPSPEGPEDEASTKNSIGRT